MKRLLIIAILLAGCASEEELCAEKIAKLESLKREAAANVIRQKAECQAVAYEFRDAKMTEDCAETLSAIAQIAQNISSMASKRLEEPDMQRCKANFFDRFDEKQ